MAWAHVQDTPGSNNVGAGVSLLTQSAGPFGSPVTINNIVVIFGWGFSTGAIGVITCTDNGTTPNIYSSLVTATTGSTWVEIFASEISHNPASGNLNITINSSNSTDIQICGAEFSGGTLTIDGANSGTGTAATSPTPGVVTGTAGDLFLAAATDESGSTESITNPLNWTSVGIETNGSGHDVGQGIYNISAITGLNPAFNLGSLQIWAAVQVALKAAAIVPVPGSILQFGIGS